jgi:hypothetical protein
MAAGSVTPDVYWVFDPATKLVNICHEGKILESCPLSVAAHRLSHHRHAVAKRSTWTTRRVEAPAYKRHAR